MAVRGWNTFCSSCTCIHKASAGLANADDRRTDTAEHGRPAGGFCTPRFAVTVRDPLLILEKAGAFEHQLKTIGKLTDGYCAVGCSLKYLRTRIRRASGSQHGQRRGAWFDIVGSRRTAKRAC